MNHIFSSLISKDKPICVIGLGYVGLPLALEMARHFKVVGFDIKDKRIKLMQNHQDPSNELEPEAFEGCDISFTSKTDDIRNAVFYIVAVPTPIDEYKIPDLKPLLAACRTVGSVLKKGDTVVFESTVYPGCTEDDCVPEMEKSSDLSYLSDFKVGYSPERINPGDLEHTLTRITKVVSGCDLDTLDLIHDVYGKVISAGIFKASSIKVAEASKVIENTQRDLNIALMNELSSIFKKMNINTYEVLEASSTKWNFLRFFPGLVGGHCIGVDPYYLTHKAMELGYFPKVITAGRNINDSVHSLIAREVVQHLIEEDKVLRQTKVLVMGTTFKENVTDIRNSKVPELIRELRDFKINVDAIDPYADGAEFEREYGIPLMEDSKPPYDAIILAVNHEEYLNWEESKFRDLAKPNALFYDVKGVYRHKIQQMNYLSL